MQEPIQNESNPDWQAIARAYGLGIPDDEIERFAPGLTALVSECREAVVENLELEEPIGSFNPR